MSRQETPDIMGSLMTGTPNLIEKKQENNIGIEQENNKYSEQEEALSTKEKFENNKAINLPKNKTIKQDSNMEITETKEKATFNLSSNILKDLEDAWIKLKRQIKGEQRITKTAIVEMALEICIKEFEERESESLLHKMAILRNNTKLSDNKLT